MTNKTNKQNANNYIDLLDDDDSSSDEFIDTEPRLPPPIILDADGKQHSLPRGFFSKQRTPTGTGGGIHTSSLTNEEKMNLFNSLDAKEQLIFFEQLDSYRKSKSVGVAAAAAAPKKATTFEENVSAENSSSEDESSQDDDDLSHGFVKQDYTPSPIAYLDEELEVIAFFVSSNKSKKKPSVKYYDKDMKLLVMNNKEKISLRVSDGDIKEDEKWTTFTDDDKFPSFFFEVICGGEFINFKDNSTRRLYKAVLDHPERGQWKSADGNFIFGCNNVDGVANDLFQSGRITKEMRQKMINLKSHANNSNIFYFINLVNHKIAFVYQSDGCNYANGDVGKVASILVEGYTAQRKYNK